MQITITMDDVVSWASRDVDFELDLRAIPEDKLAGLIAQAATMGFRKAGVDAAASALKYAQNILADELKVPAKRTDADLAKVWATIQGDEQERRTEDATRELTEKKIAVWLSGDWGATRTGDGMTRVERAAVSAVRPAIKARDEKAYKSWTEKERFAACAEYFETLPKETQEAMLRIAAESLRRADEAKKAEQAAFAEIGITF